MSFFTHVTREEALNFFTELIAAEGHKDVPQKESFVVKKLSEFFEKEQIPIDFEDIEENRSNIYATLKGYDEELELLFNGHTDTIPGFQMDFDPFKPFVKDGNLYGRGACDMKAGLSAFALAMAAIKRSSVYIKKTVMFAGVIDEEERSKGSVALVKSGKRPKYVLVGEPTSLEVCVAHKGMEWIEIICQGRSTHASTPENGVNAVYMASSIAGEIEKVLQPDIEANKHPLLGSGSICVGVLRGGDDPNIVPDRAILQIDRRWLPTQTLEEIYEELEIIAQKVAVSYGGSVEVRGLDELTCEMKNLPYSLDTKDPFVDRVIKVVEQVTKQTKAATAFPAWSDAGLLANFSGSKCIVLGPGDIGKAHSSDEYCPIDEFYQVCEIYYQLILEYCVKENHEI